MAIWGVFVEIVAMEDIVVEEVAAEAEFVACAHLGCGISVNFPVFAEGGKKGMGLDIVLELMVKFMSKFLELCKDLVLIIMC